MKIAIFTDCFLPQINGVVTSTVTFAKGMAKRGHTVYVFAPKNGDNGDDGELSHPNIIVTRVPSLPAFFYKNFRFTSPFSYKIYKYLKRINVDIIHFHTPIGLGLQAIIHSKLLGAPLVGTFHTFFPNREYLKHAGLSNWLFHKIAWLYSKFFYNRCRLISCPSKGAKNELLHHNFRSRIIVVSNGIDLDLFGQSENDKTLHNRGNDKDLILYVGRIAHEKNIIFMIDCFRKVVERSPKTKLLIVGDGPQMDELKERISGHSLEDNVIITGEIQHSALSKSSIFESCKLFITASFTETQGITTLEAQANNLVCVGVDSTGTNELIKDGVNGYVVKKNDKDGFASKVLTLLSDEALYNKMRKNTVIEIQKHDIKKIILIWEREYRNLLDRAMQTSGNHIPEAIDTTR